MGVFAVGHRQQDQEKLLMVNVLEDVIDVENPNALVPMVVVVVLVVAVHDVFLHVLEDHVVMYNHEDMHLVNLDVKHDDKI